jgi:hypothetical protein
MILKAYISKTCVTIVASCTFTITSDPPGYVARNIPLFGVFEERKKVVVLARLDEHNDSL